MSTAKRSQFEECAIASRLLGEKDLDEARSGVRWSEGDQPEATAPPSDRQLADRLVEIGKLTAWQARQLLEGRTKFNLGRTVAVKVLPKSKSTPEAIASFAREIRALASLDHPRLVRALDAGHDGNVYYLVTEFVPGSDLRKLVRAKGPLSMEAAAQIVVQVAEGLAHAHSHGLIHRDVKPGNVLVTPEGEAKLSDLGLAGPLDGDVEKDPRFGKIVGTADYLSPDHINDPWTPTPAWDIYSLGCTLYYAVTGKVPFPGGTTADKARAHRELRPLDPRRLNHRLSNEFVDVMADMMAKDPAQRTPSANEVIRRLAPWARRGRTVDAVGHGVDLPPRLPPRPIPVPPRATPAAAAARALPPPIRPQPAEPLAGLRLRDTEPIMPDDGEPGSDSAESASQVVQTTDPPIGAVGDSSWVGSLSTFASSRQRAGVRTAVLVVAAVLGLLLLLLGVWAISHLAG